MTLRDELSNEQMRLVRILSSDETAMRCTIQARLCNVTEQIAQLDSGTHWTQQAQGDTLARIVVRDLAVGKRTAFHAARDNRKDGTE